MRVFCLFLALCLSAFAADCTLQFGPSTAIGTSNNLDNRNRGCVYLRLTYVASGFSALTISIQGAPDSAGDPGTFADISSTVLEGSNPSTTTNQSTIAIRAYYPWLRINFSAKTGTGQMKATLFGWEGFQLSGLSDLTNGGAVPYVASAGILAEMSGAAWNNTTRRLSVANSDSEPMWYLYGRKTGGAYAEFNPDYVRASEVSTATGATGSGFGVAGVDGGHTTIATTGTGGNGGEVYIDTGGGGRASAAVTASTGGDSGGFFITMGAAGLSDVVGSGTNTGGNGGTFRIRSSSGGTAINGATNVGGNASNLLFELGSGGVGSTSQGSDGTFLIQAGDKANASIFKVQSNGGSTDFVRVLTGGTFATYAGANVASATTTTLTAGNTFHITGTNSITTLNTCDATNAGREVTLIFDGVLTFTDGNNLKLAGNFVTTADDVIRLVCDGSSWYEQSRSIN